MANLLTYSKKLIFSIFMLLISISSFSQPNSNYRLVYSDEFNSLPAPPKWNVEQFGQAGGLPENCFSDGHGYYTDPNSVSVQNGILTIKGGQYSVTQNTTYYAGGISTAYVPQFGYYEIRCKMPSKIGFYPAFVFYNYSSSSWQEIDVFEYNAEKTFYQASLHYETDNDGIHGNNDQTCSSPISVPIISNSYHTYGVDWQPSSVTFYFDGIPKKTCNTYNVQEPMIMGIGLGVDVCYGNSPPNANDVSFSGNEESQQFKIDYFRHYQKQNEALRFLHTNNNFCINSTQNRVAISNYPNAQYSWVIPSQMGAIQNYATPFFNMFVIISNFSLR